MKPLAQKEKYNVLERGYWSINIRKKKRIYNMWLATHSTKDRTYYSHCAWDNRYMQIYQIHECSRSSEARKTLKVT